MPFLHGQHLTLRRAFDDTELRRGYSICSPAPDGVLRVAIRRVDGGVFSSWAVTDLRAGDELDVLPPSGHFTHELDAAAARRYSMLAAGSGITPILSIAATILREEPMSRVALVYVNRTSRTTMLLDDVHDLHDRHLGRFTITFVFTRESGDARLQIM
jgi:ring-1,2-phenylacetyl-CoA epoxidase subunit PaaE